MQEGNITEAGEEEVTRALRAGLERVRAGARRATCASPAAPNARTAYFRVLQPTFLRIKQRADDILAMNQDAMVRKSDQVADRAHLLEQLVTAAVVLASILGLLAATWLIARVLRPLRVVSAAVRRFGEGDLKARADVRGDDEIAAVAAEFNRMAERLERYRASSLGELLQAQQAAQAAIDGLADPVLLLDAHGQAAGRERRRVVDARRSTRSARAPIRSRASIPGVRALVDRLRGARAGGQGRRTSRRGSRRRCASRRRPKASGCCFRAATPIYGEDGTVAGAAIVLQDITRLFRFDELKNDLVATVAHEFRTPLTSLRMALHLCTEEAVGPLTPKQADLLFAAREDCERLQVIVDELLNLSRIESGTIELHRRRTDPAALVDMADRAASRRGRAGAGRRSAPRCCPGCRRCSSIPTACSWCSRTC